MRRIAIATLAALLAGVLTMTSPTSASAESSETNPPAGANDWSCQPTTAHPNPVMLLHGLGANAGLNWSYLSPKLKARGYCVFAVTYGLDPRFAALGLGGTIAIEESATEIGAFVHKVLAATGAEKVDLVGHSEGTYTPQYWLKFLGGAEQVDKYVAYTPLYDGSELAPVLVPILGPVCEFCKQIAPGSDMQKKLSEGGAAVLGVDYTTVMTRYDEAVWPYTSGYLEGETNVVLQDVCPFNLSGHATMAIDPVAAQVAFNALDPAHKKPINCWRLPAA